MNAKKMFLLGLGIIVVCAIPWAVHEIVYDPKRIHVGYMLIAVGGVLMGFVGILASVIMAAGDREEPTDSS